eukprot:TRINITY_DN14116_c0_g1_i2.p2 TRINITY_DN14116_c0_g1~~TRINITY_DN14116_c0_g1_i2.p2  ORF type:complete len:123 (+),score=16.18 TRINITY_DN14116_c0_g1_i2:40-408(+)
MCILVFLFLFFFFFFFKQKTAYEIMPSLVGSEMCIRDRVSTQSTWEALEFTHNDTPYNKLLLFADVQCRIARIFCNQRYPACTSIQPLHQSLTIHEGDHDMAVLRSNTFIDKKKKQKLKPKG